MNIETNNEVINLCESVANENKNIMIEGELVVPDIKPDILSIANIDGEVFVTKYEVKDGKLHVEGMADVSAIYLAEDATTSIKSLNNVFSFHEIFDVANLTDESIIKVRAIKRPIEFKVLNSRKISVRISALLVIEIKNNCSHTFVKEIVDDRNIEIQSEEVEFFNLCDSKTQNIELNEIIMLEQNKLPIAEILKANIKIVNPEYKISYNKILAKADAIVNIIYISDSERQSIETFEANVPVMGFINYENIDDESNIELSFGVKSFTLRPIYQDLKSTSFSIESEMEVRADICKKNKLVVISDMYDPDSELKCEYEKMNIEKEIINVSESTEMVQALMIPELDSIRILTIDATSNINNKNILDGKIAIEGSIEFEILYYNEMKQVIDTKKVDLPYQQVIKIPEVKNGMNVDISAVTDSVEYRRIDDGQIQLKVNMKFNAKVKDNLNIEGVARITAEDIDMSEIPSVVIYYVKPNDTLWKIAKKYHTTVDEIKEYNALKDEMIYPNEQLIIPKRTRKIVTQLL